MTISIPDSWRRNSNQKHTMEMLEHALERTRGHPLDFMFEDHNSLDAGERDVMDRCFNLMNALLSAVEKSRVYSSSLSSSMSLSFSREDRIA